MSSSVSNAFDGLMMTEGGDYDDDDDGFGDFTDAPNTISPPSPPDDAEAASSETSTITPSSLTFYTTLPNFHPTPLEYAYATFLLATYFSIPPPPPPPPPPLVTQTDTQTSNSNSCTNDYFTKIQLLGSSAAPLLLTATNVPIPLIHACWNVVDPTGSGVLTHRIQFAILLRLIALAQAHLIPATSGNSNPTDLLLGTLERTKQLTVTLPTFAALESVANNGGVGSVPSVARLLELYPPPSSSSSTTSNMSNSSFGAGIKKTYSGEGIRTLSINDAFDSLIATITSPLPSMQLNIAAPTHVDLSINDIVDGDDDDDEFGDFLGVQAGVADKVGEELAKEEVAVNDDDDDFGNFESPPSPLTTNNVNNGFGKFDDNNTTRDPQLKFASSMNNGHIQTMSTSDAFDELIGVDNDVTTLDNQQMSSPMNNEIELNNGNDENNDNEFGDFEATEEGIAGSTPANDNDFGDFEEPTHEASMSANDINDNMKILSITDTFKNVSVDEVVKRDHIVPSENIPINVAEDDKNPKNNDDFGNFGTAADDDNEFGDFDTATPDVILGNGKTLSISDAFEGLLAEETVTDLPLPPLTVDNENVAHDDPDAFGEFEAPAAINDFGDFDAPSESSLHADSITSSHMKTLSISDAFEVLIANDTSTAQCDSSSVNDVSDDNIDTFEDFNEATNKLPLQLMKADENNTEVEKFGGYDATRDALGHVKTLSISDAFEGLIHEEEMTIDQPLQPMKADADENNDTGDFVARTEVEEFGSLNGPAPQDSSRIANDNTHVKTLSISDAFKGCIKEESEASPTAQFGRSSIDIVQDDENIDIGVDDENDKFDILDTPAHDKPIVNNHTKTLSISGAFEGLITEETVTDLPLPPLTVADDVAHDDPDDFGDFEAPAAIDDFGVFDAPSESSLHADSITSSHVKMLSISDAFEELIANDTSAAQCDSSSVNDVVDDNIDAFEDFNKAEIDWPLQPVIVDSNENNDIENEDENEVVNNHIKTLSISDSFEGLIQETEVIDRSLPPLSNVEAGIDDDDFGDFETPAVDKNELVEEKVLNQPLPLLVIPSTIELSHQRMVSEITTAGGTWKDTAAISASSAMMPSFKESGNQIIDEINDMIDDDFGDFEGVEGDDSGVDGEGIAGEDFTSPLEYEVLSINKHDDFGEFGVVDESNYIISVNDSDGFGDSAAPPQNESALHVNSHVMTVSVSDAFDELLSEGATLDYPLPPMMPLLIPTAVDNMNDLDSAADALEFREPSSLIFGCGHDSEHSSSNVDEFGDISGKVGESISCGDDKNDPLVQEVENVDISTKSILVDIVDAGDRKFEEEKKTNFDDGNYHNNESGEFKAAEESLSANLDIDGEARFDENDNFGEFVDFPSQENETKVTSAFTDETLILNDDGDDSFGQFGDFPGTTIAHYTTEELTGHNTSTSAQEFINKEDDLFGDFGDATHDISETVKDADGFGQFDAFPALTDAGGATDLFVASSSTVHNDDDFGTFDGSDTIHQSNGGTGHEDDNNDHDHDNFGDFSSTVANDTPHLSSDKEFVLEDILGVEFGRLVDVWKDVVLSAVECDLQKGIKTMDDLSTDRTCIIKSLKFHDYIFGLAEFVRLVRCISATIGDLLCVEKNIEVQETNLSQWKDNAIIAYAIVIEYLWSQLLSTSVALGMSTIPLLESVVEIRARGSINVDDLNNKVSLCQLTLRPLEGGTGTQSCVVWNGNVYMACAANFCANRVPGQAFD